MADELWLSIPGYEGLYAVSNKGRVKSLARKTYTGNRSVPEIIRKPNIMKGYHCIALKKCGKTKVFRIHRLVLEAFGKPQPGSKYEVNHIDGNKGNNCLENLEWCTPKENTAHAFNTGLRKIHPSEETRRRIGEGSRRAWTNPDYRNFQRKMMTETWKRRKENGWTSWKTTN